MRKPSISRALLRVSDDGKWRGHRRERRSCARALCDVLVAMLNDGTLQAQSAWRWAG